MQPPNASTSSNFTQPVFGPTTPVQTSNLFSLNIHGQTQPGCQPALPTQTLNIFSAPTQASGAFNLSQTKSASTTGLPTVPALKSNIFSVPTQTSSVFNCNQAQPDSWKTLPTGIPQMSSPFNVNQTLPASSNRLIAAPVQTLSTFPLPTQITSPFHTCQKHPAPSNCLMAVPLPSISSVPTQTPSAFNLSQIQPASSTGLPIVPAQTSTFSTGLAGTSGDSGQGSIGHLYSYQSNAMMQPVSISNPFGTLPSLHQLSLGPVQYGISSMPVAQKSAAIRTSPLSARRHVSQRRISLPMRKHNPKIDRPKVPFFMDNEERKAPSVVDQLFIPREDPRSFLTGSIRQWHPKAGPDKQPTGKDTDNPTNENANPLSPSKSTAKVNEHDVDVEVLMPKLRHADYYTEPHVQELAAKERARPGFCRHVKDFVVGRHGYGCIKFYGETDVRRLDIESIIRFNDREVIVYEDGSKKPPIGQGLNKAAEVTLLNVKCIKKGRHYTEGTIVEKYEGLLMKKAEEQGAEFVSFDAVEGLWKFRVQHF